MRKRAKKSRPASYSLEGANLPNSNFGTLGPKTQAICEIQPLFRAFFGFQRLPTTPRKLLKQFCQPEGVLAPG
jgi:hypothetical protein